MKTTPKYHFAKPVTLEYFNDSVKKKNSMPVKTRQQADWSVALWLEWRLNRIKNGENSVDSPPRICDLSTEEMSSWLKHILAGIQRPLRNESSVKINFFKDPSFSLLRMDSRMKDLRSEKKEKENRNFSQKFPASSQKCLF